MTATHHMLWVRARDSLADWDGGFGEPTRKALILDLAPEGRQAATFGTYYLARDTVVSLAAFGGAFLWQLGPAVNFGAAFAFGLAGTLWFALRGRDLGRAASAPAPRE